MTDSVDTGVRLLADRYEVGERIGRGGMADVHVGMDRRLGRKVAIKLLRSTLADDPAFRSRFRREAHDAAKMAHPTIVRIFDAGEESVIDATGEERLMPFIVMEYVDGTLLRDIVAEGPLEPHEAARVTGQVLTALEYSHRAGVIHRDIKPGNVMLSRNGQVKVMDFGIARAVSDSSATVAETSKIMGTAQYFSPEQARGETVDARSDLYSTGVMLFELLTGKPPFRGDNPVAVAYQHVNADPVAPSALNPEVSPALDAVTLRAMAKDRFDRYQSAAEFRDSLAAADAGELPDAPVVRAKPDFQSTLYGMNPDLVSGTEVAMRQLGDDGARGRVAATQSRPPVGWIWVGIVILLAIIGGVVYWTLNLQPPQIGGDATVSVPDVSGQSWEQAEATLTGLGLTAQRFDQSSETIAIDNVIVTEPGPGIVVEPGQLVRVTVSSGAESFAVPDVSRMDVATAQAKIEELGFVFGQVTSQYSPDVPKDTVISSLPAAGALEPKGSTINIVVSNGLVNVPSIVGQSLANATTTLEQLGLQVRASIDQSCGGGLVTSQSITGDQAQGSAIAITACVP